jgi:hypothetical protein
VSPRVADNEEGIKEVKKRVLMLSCLFTLLWLLEALQFVYRTKPFFFYLFNLDVISILDFSFKAILFEVRKSYCAKYPPSTP